MNLRSAHRCERGDVEVLGRGTRLEVVDGHTTRLETRSSVVVGHLRHLFDGTDVTIRNDTPVRTTYFHNVPEYKTHYDA